MILPVVSVTSRACDAVVSVALGGDTFVELEGMAHGQAVAVAEAIRETVDALLRVNGLVPVFSSEKQP